MIDEHVVEEEVRGPRGPWWNPWIWLALLAVAVAAAAIVFFAALADRTDEEEEEEAPATTETVAVVPPDTLVAAPELIGLDHADASREAEDAGFVADTFPVESEEPAGRVVAQVPAPGTELETTEHLRLDVSIGTEPFVAVAVPDVTGIEAAQAREILRRAGFTILTVERAAPSPADAGRVLEQEPAAGLEEAPLTQVTLFIGQ